MPGPVALVYGDELMKHHLSDQHPLQPIRVKLAMDLIRSTGLIEHCHLLPPRRATINELELVPSPDEWLKGATSTGGSWWDRWREWTSERSGEMRRAPKNLGSKRHKPGAKAPGTYVLES